MKIEFDPSNPQEVAMVAALIGVGHVAQTTQPQVISQPAPVAPVPTTAPVVSPVQPQTMVAPVTAPAPVVQTPVTPVTASPSSAADHGALAAAMQAYAKANGAAAAKALLAKYGAKKVTDVQAAHLPQILQEAAV